MENTQREKKKAKQKIYVQNPMDNQNKHYNAEVNVKKTEPKIEKGGESIPSKQHLRKFPGYSEDDVKAILRSTDVNTGDTSDGGGSSSSSMNGDHMDYSTHEYESSASHSSLEMMVGPPGDFDWIAAGARPKNGLNSLFQQTHSPQKVCFTL